MATAIAIGGGINIGGGISVGAESAPAIISYSKPGDYANGAVLITQLDGNKLIIVPAGWITSTATILALPSSTVIDILYKSALTPYELTLTSGFTYVGFQDWWEATFTSLTPTPGAALDGVVNAISFAA
jgi:hypothetical protein